MSEALGLIETKGYVALIHATDAMLKAGKDVEFMMYPGEFHYFSRAHVLRDAWQKTERFFQAHLRVAAAPVDGPPR